MHTTYAQRIAQLTRQGLWGNDTLHRLLRDQVNRAPDQLAVAYQSNREALTGDKR